MIDSIFKVYLIEINTNPCFELCCGLLRKIIPNMIENAIRFLNYNLELQSILFFHLLNIQNGDLKKIIIFQKNVWKLIGLS